MIYFYLLKIEHFEIILMTIPSFLMKNIWSSNKQSSNDFHTLKVWFYDNFLVLNPGKFHFMTLGNGNNRCNFSCDDIIIKNSLSEKTLELTVDNNLAFSDRRCRSQTSADVFVFNGSCKVHKKCVDGWHLSDQFYLFYKHLHTSLQSI